MSGTISSNWQAIDRLLVTAVSEDGVRQSIDHRGGAHVADESGQAMSHLVGKMNCQAVADSARVDF